MDYAKEDYGVSHTLHFLVHCNPTSILFFPSFHDIFYFLSVFPFCVCNVSTVGCVQCTCRNMHVLRVVIFSRSQV